MIVDLRGHDKRNIAIVGDIHADWASLNHMINRAKPEIILQVGDFGYWPDSYPLSNIKLGNCEIYFADGNHEHHDRLDDIRKSNNFVVHPGITYMPRGSIMYLPNGSKCLFIGGAVSIDQHMRKEFINWFRQETISEIDIQNLPDVDDIDIVISHTAPLEFDMKESIVFPDPSRKALSYVLDRYRPKLWFSGHYHYFLNGSYTHDDSKITNWYTLAELGKTRGWVWIDHRDKQSC